MMLLVLFLMLMAVLSYVVQERRTSYGIGLLTCIGGWVLWVMAYQTGDNSSNWASVSFFNDGISRLLSALVLFLGSAVFLYSWGYLQHGSEQHRHLALLFMLLAFAIAVCQAGDAFNLWLWFEGMALAATSLVMARENDLALEASFKYLIQSAVGTVFILAAIALIFAQSGSLSFAEIGTLENAGLIAVLLIIGFGVKAAFVPLHTWLPDAHSQAPSGISALLSGMVIEVALIAMLRFLSVLGANVGFLLMCFGLVNILVGNFLALKQDEIKRLLAFSSVAHLGYITLGFGIAFYTGEATAFEGAFFHLLSHGLMKGLAFLTVGVLVFLAEGTLKREDLDGFGKAYPLMGFALSLALLGLGGLPPMVGFFSKWQIFVGGAMSGDNTVIFFILLAALGSIISLGYYAPLVSRIYKEEVAKSMKQTVIPLSMRLPIIVLGAVVLVLGLYPLLLNPLLQSAAQIWLGH